jgi:hypothetical protein
MWTATMMVMMWWLAGSAFCAARFGGRLFIAASQSGKTDRE